MASTVLAGLRVLVVEDEFLVSVLIEDVLTDHGCKIVGPFGRVAEAMAAARAEVIDLAVLDVNVAGLVVYPVAEVLAARGIPFVFLSGYGQTAVPRDRPHWLVCTKPFRTETLVAMLEAQIQRKKV